MKSVKISIHCLKKIRCLQLAENLAFGDLLPEWTDAVEWLLDIGTINAYAPTVC